MRGSTAADAFLTTDRYRDHRSVVARSDRVEPDELLTEAWEVRAPRPLR